MPKKRILLTGATGLVGSRLLKDLLDAGNDVVAMKRENSGMLNVNRLLTGNEQGSVTWITGDVTDIFSVDEALEGTDTVYHAAAFISFHSSDRQRMMKVNAGGTANMVNLSVKHGIRRFCHISSVAAIGREAGAGIIDENSVWKTSRDNSNYAISKYAAEREVWRAMEEGLNAFIINPSIVVGPGDWHTGSSMMFSQVWKGFPFYSSGVTGFVDVRDVSKSAMLLMEKEISGERFIVSSENVSFRFVFDEIAEALGKRKPSVMVGKRLASIGWRLEAVRSAFSGTKPMITKETAHSSQMKWFYSNEKVKKTAGIEFITVKDAIRETARYFSEENSVNQPAVIRPA